MMQGEIMDSQKISSRTGRELMNRLNTVTKEYGVKISVKKTKVMCIS